MNISDIVKNLDNILDGVDAEESSHGLFKKFLESDHIYRHLLSLGHGVLDSFKNNDYATNPINSSKLLLLHSGTTDSGRSRTLYLWNGQTPLSIYQASPEKRITIPFQDMTVDKYKITGNAPEKAYSLPDKSLKLEHLGSFVVAAGTALLRNDPLELHVIQEDKNLRSLVYLDNGNDISYGLAFDKSNLQFVGTSMVDVRAAKSIAFIELLEEFNSDYLGEAALQLTGHRSPIVRWRSLSSLNKISHPEVPRILEKFCDDEALFISTAAKRVLQQGRVK